jgi:hypothetical protein
MAKNGIKVSSSGDVCIPAVGRRTITTANAYQKMVKPEFGGLSSWNSFVRVYETDLTVPLYSSLVVGVWDTLTQAGGSNTELFGLHKTIDGVICVGRHTATNGQANGNDIPVINIPNWGAEHPENESCILVYYKAANLNNPMDGPAAMSAQNKPSRTPQQLSIYPNPTSDHLYFSSLASEIVVYDNLGKRVMSATKTDRISTQSLSNGVYIVETDGQFHKLVVQR